MAGGTANAKALTWERACQMSTGGRGGWREEEGVAGNEEVASKTVMGPCSSRKRRGGAEGEGLARRVEEKGGNREEEEEAKEKMEWRRVKRC